VFVGPNAPVSNGTLIPVLEKQAAYMTSMIRKYQREHLKSFSPLVCPTKLLNRRHQEWLRRTVWTDSCRSTYKGGKRDGKVIGPWPGSSLHYYEAISEVKFEDWEYTYHESDVDAELAEDTPGAGMWKYLGNGFTQLEMKDKENGGKEDLAWYLEKPQSVLQVLGSSW
jgi:hypothetical protein